jgi:hypothetical protein
MEKYAIIKSISLLVIIVAGTILGLYEAFSFLFIEKENRKFWIKACVIIGAVVGLIFWVILIGWGQI